MAQRVAGRLIVAAEKIHIKNIFPGTPAPGRDSILVKLMSRKANTASALNSAPGNILDAEGDGSFVSAGQNVPGLSDQEEPREIPLVVLYAGGQDMTPYAFAAWAPAIPAASCNPLSLHA